MTVSRVADPRLAEALTELRRVALGEASEFTAPNGSEVTLESDQDRLSFIAGGLSALVPALPGPPPLTAEEAAELLRRLDVEGVSPTAAAKLRALAAPGGEELPSWMDARRLSERQRHEIDARTGGIAGGVLDGEYDTPNG